MQALLQKKCSLACGLMVPLFAIFATACGSGGETQKSGAGGSTRSGDTDSASGGAGTASGSAGTAPGGASSASGGASAGAGRASAGAGGTSQASGGSDVAASATANFQIDVTLSSAIATVGTVEWSIDATMDSAYIEFGRDPNAFEYQAPVDLAEPDYRTLLLGMKPSTIYYLRVVAHGGGETYVSDVQSVDTGFLPNGLPVQNVTDHDAAALYAGGGFTVACTGYDTYADIGSNPSWVFIFDQDGDQVWALDMSSTAAQGCTRARLSLDAKHMWAGNFGNFSASGALSRVTMDGLGTPEDFSLPGRSHDFAVLPNGHVVYFARQDGGSGQSPESIMELDPDTGTTTLIYDQLTDFQQQIATQGGHTNQVNYVPELDAVSFSMLFADTIALVSYPEGELLAVFGGSQSTFDGMSWDGQHGHDVRMDHITIFNNDGRNGGASVLRYQYDPQGGSSTELPDYSSGIDSVAFGDVKELPNGNFFVTYSSASVMHEISPSFALLREIETNVLIGYTEHRATLYGPPPPFDR